MKHDLKKMEKQAKTIQIFTDLRRIPYKIVIKKGFFKFTTDQWKTLF